MDTITLPTYANKGKARETATFQVLTLGEVRQWTDYANTPSHVWFVTVNGDAREAKVNGKVRTWKRDATRIELPLKYGLYEYATFDARDIEIGRLLRRIN